MSARNPSIQTEGDLITLDRKTATSASPIGYMGRDQRPKEWLPSYYRAWYALVVTFDGRSSTMIKAMREKKNPKISHPIGCRPFRLAML